MLFKRCLESGNVYTMGSNKEGKLGINNKDFQFVLSPTLVDSLMHSQITDISCGEDHTIAISKFGECYSWGQGIHGELGIG